MLRAACAAVGALLLLALTPPVPAGASVPVLVLDGTGYGHGVGLSQWGVEHLARTGRSTAEILGTFYPGASLGTASGPVRVAVHRPATSTTTLTFPEGGEVRSPLEGEQAAGFPIRVGPGGRVRVTFDGAYRVDPLVVAAATSPATPYQECWLGDLCPLITPPPPPPPSTTTPPPTTSPPPPGATPPPGQPGEPAAPGPPAAAASPNPVWAVPSPGGSTTVDERGRSYRGVLEATGAGGLRLVNLVGIEDYLRGMAEVPGTWPAAAVQAQTIAARTYGLRAMAASGELCDDARCQVYVGRTAESPGQDAAVAATAGQVVAYGGALAAAVYSADAGGVSATTLEGFGTPDGVYPYLTTVRYDTDNPLPWHLTVSLGDLGARLGYPGTVTGVRVGQTGPSGRALTMVLAGSAGEVSVDGRTFARSLGLRSTRFTATVGSADGTPAPPPPAGEALQLLPEETATPAARPRIDRELPRVERAAPQRTPRPVRAAVPPGLDPRRHPLTLAAAFGLVGLVALHLHVARVRAWRPWTTPTRGP